MDTLKERFEDRFDGNLFGVLRDGKIEHPEYAPLTKENILAFIKEELNRLAEEVDKRKNREDMNLEVAVRIIRSKAELTMENKPEGIGARAPKASEKDIQRQALRDLTQMDEAPTDEGWEKEYNETKWFFYKGINGTVKSLTGTHLYALRDFIASLLQKQKEEIEEKYYQPNKTISLTKEYARGKSEAFSLVRKAITDYDRIKCGRCYSGDIQLHHILACTMRTDLLHNLSTLEGK